MTRRARSLPSPSRQRAFTLIEMVVVIVITGIIGGIVALFIRLPVQGYVDSAARAELSDIADTAMRRFTRDLHLALPNSVRISADGRYLELLLTKTGGRYLSEDDGQGLNGVLNFTSSAPSPAPNSFTIVGAAPSGTQAIVPGDSVVVYNLGSGFAPADAYCPDGADQCNRAKVVGVAGTSVTLADNPFLRQSPAMQSPSSRFQVVSTPVTYYCDSISGGVAKAGTLTRYSEYAIQAAQPVSAAAAPLTGAGHASLLASKVNSCVFSFNSLVNSPRALISLTLGLGEPMSDVGSVTLSQQVHVDNTP